MGSSYSLPIAKLHGLSDPLYGPDSPVNTKYSFIGVHRICHIEIPIKTVYSSIQKLYRYSLCLPLEDNLKLKRLVLRFHRDHLAKIRPSHRLAFDKDNLKILVLAVRVSILLVDLSKENKQRNGLQASLKF